MTKSSELVFKYFDLQISLKIGSVLKRDLQMSGFKWDRPQPWKLLISGEIWQKTRCNLFYNTLKACTMVFARVLQKSEASVVGVCLIWDLLSKDPFWVLNHFWGIFSRWDIWKPTLIFLSIINVQYSFVYFQNQR